MDGSEVEVCKCEKETCAEENIVCTVQTDQEGNVQSICICQENLNEESSDMLTENSSSTNLTSNQTNTTTSINHYQSTSSKN